MMELVEVVLVEILEEPGRADRMRGDRQVVDVVVPVGPDARGEGRFGQGRARHEH